ncbi:MAG: hypothetical protein JXA42_20025 [Anaerolineales bacterium]|nr:hypothetical protein [Anaerolineales bacterium]
MKKLDELLLFINVSALVSSVIILAIVGGVPFYLCQSGEGMLLGMMLGFYFPVLLIGFGMVTTGYLALLILNSWITIYNIKSGVGVKCLWRELLAFGGLTIIFLANVVVSWIVTRPLWPIVFRSIVGAN